MFRVFFFVLVFLIARPPLSYFFSLASRINWAPACVQVCVVAHRGRSGHVAEKVKVVDVLPVSSEAGGERGDKGERERAVTHHNNESIMSEHSPYLLQEKKRRKEI